MQHHINLYRDSCPDAVQQIEKGQYVDDLLTEEQTVEKIRKIKDTATDIFGKDSFKVHK